MREFTISIADNDAVYAAYERAHGHTVSYAFPNPLTDTVANGICLGSVLDACPNCDPNSFDSEPQSCPNCYPG